MITKEFPAKRELLDEVIAFTEGELEAADCSMKALMQIDVALEEMFVNVASYAYPEGGGSVRLGIDVKDGRAEITLADAGLPFDPLAAADPDTTLAAEDRRIGGLGIFMVKKTMDEVRYERTDSENIFTMVKKI